MPVRLPPRARTPVNVTAAVSGAPGPVLASREEGHDGAHAPSCPSLP